jgi:hypothetical protein
LEDPEIESFTQDHDDLEFDRPIRQEDDLNEPSLEDIELESFAQLGHEQYFDKVVELLTSICDPMSELQPECEDTTSTFGT